MEKVERFYIGPQIEMPRIRSEACAGGVPTVAVAKAGNHVFTNRVVSNDPKTGEPIEIAGSKTIKPLDTNIKEYPMPGEYVIVAKYFDDSYYTQKINMYYIFII